MEHPFDESKGRDMRLLKDDWMHGTLLVINEILRCSNVEGEVAIALVTNLSIAWSTISIVSSTVRTILFTYLFC